MKIVDDGIFIHKIPYSETSAIVSYFTKESGFQKFIFPGGRKKNTQLFALNVQQLTFYKRPDSELGKLTGAESNGLVQNIPFHPLRSAIAYFVAEVCHKCLNHTEKDEALFHFLVDTIEILDKADDLSTFPHQFLLQFTHYLGIQPQIECEEPLCFEMKNGVFNRETYRNDSLTGEEMHLLLDLMKNKKRLVSRKVRQKALRGLLTYYRLHIEYFGQLKSMDVFDEVFE